MAEDNINQIITLRLGLSLCISEFWHCVLGFCQDLCHVTVCVRLSKSDLLKQRSSLTVCLKEVMICEHCVVLHDKVQH